MSTLPLTLPVALGGEDAGTVSSTLPLDLPATLGAGGVGSISSTLPFTLPATLAAHEYGTQTRVAVISGTGILSAIARESYTRSPTLSGTGVLSSVARQSYSRSATLSGTGTLSAAASGDIGARALLSTTGTLSATVGKIKDSFTVPLSTVGILSATVHGNVPTEPSGAPEWAKSVNAFAAASRKSTVTTTAMQLQFPSTNQLTGVCSQLFSGSAFTSGLLNYGDPNTQGVAGAVVSGTQTTLDSLCNLLGGVGSGTTPQSVVSGATDVQGAIDASPMASGTIVLGQNGQPTNNVALDAINGVQNLANTLYSILQACGCGAQNDPVSVTPQQVIDTTQQTADSVTGSPFASGIITMGQDPSSGNVAVDAINGVQTFANLLFGILSICSCGQQGGAGLRGGQLFGAGESNPYSPDNIDPQTVIDVAQAVADTVSENPFALDLFGAQSGNLGIDAVLYGQSLVDSAHAAIANTLATDNTLQDVVNASTSAIQQNTANHVGHTSLTAAQSVALKDQNLLLSQEFSTVNTVMPDPDGHWVWDGTDGAVTMGCLKVTANGTQLDYVSNEVPVVAHETINLSCSIKYSGLSYTDSNPIAFGVAKYRLGKTAAGDTTYLDVGSFTVTNATLQTPGASSGGWLDVAGSYVVEPGVDQLRFIFRTGANCSAGTVRFDEANLLKVDLIADACVPGIGLTTDSIVTELYGTDGAGFTHNQAAVALANTAAALVSVNSRITALEAEGYSGAVGGDDFSWTGEITANANWGGGYLSSAYNGIYLADGNNAVFQKDQYWPVGTAQSCWFDWQGTGAVSDTDYQLVQAALYSAPATEHGFAASIDLYGRVSSDWTSFILARLVSDGTWSVQSFASGILTPIASGTCAVPGLGSTISLYCGDKNTSALRRFKLMVGTMVIDDFNEAGTTSHVGAANRKYGWGGWADGGLYWDSFSLLPAQGTPASLNQWLGLDQ